MIPSKKDEDVMAIDHSHPKLTKNQDLVFSALKGASAPLSAYALLDELRDDGFRAPLQVYRALEKLIEFGIVHRLESLNAFVACSHPDCGVKAVVAFTICDKCKAVTEVVSSSLTEQLKTVAQEIKFDLKSSTIELRGLCENCSA